MNNNNNIQHKNLHSTSGIATLELDNNNLATTNFNMSDHIVPSQPALSAQPRTATFQDTYLRCPAYVHESDSESPLIGLHAREIAQTHSGSEYRLKTDITREHVPLSVIHDSKGSQQFPVRALSPPPVVQAQFRAAVDTKQFSHCPAQPPLTENITGSTLQPLVCSHDQEVAQVQPGLLSPLPGEEHRNDLRFPEVDSNSKAQRTPKPITSAKAPIKTTSLDTNQLVMEKINTPPLQTIREIEPIVTSDNRLYGLAHLKIGLHAIEDSLPSWQYALIDSGCDSNLISLKALQAMPDFDKAKLTTTTAKTLRTANNDQSQAILGKITLLTSLIDIAEQRICLRQTFFVVSGLTHEIFLGQPFLTSPHISHETRDSLFFHSEKDSLSPAPKKYLQVNKSYLTRRKASCAKKLIIPPSTAAKVPTNLVYISTLNDDQYGTFRPSRQFQLKHPQIHMMYQTVQVNHVDPVTVTLVNLSRQPVTIKHATNLGHFQTFHKTDTIIHPLSDFISDDSDSDSDITIPDVNDLNALQLQSTKDPVPVTENACNAAYTASMHDHELTPDEIKDRNASFKNEGFFQKPISEVIEQSNNMPSFEYEGPDQFKNKTDQQLLSEVNLDHLNPQQRQYTLRMLERNLPAFQRHPLDIGCCSSVTAFAPLTVPNPPILYAKYVPIPAKYKAPAQALIDQYCKAGVLAPTTEACRFTSNIFIIPKKDGTFRLIFDGRILSKFCQQLPISLGSFDELFANLAGKATVTKLDVSKAYDQLPVNRKTSQLLSFFGPDSKRYCYLRSGQGLKFSSFFLTQAMDKILYGIPEARSYCDDIFIATGKDKDFYEHLDVLEKVIRSFAAHNVKLNIAKLEIAPPTLDFLGLTWSVDKLSIPKSKITGYLNLKKPTSFKQARFIVNSMAFYRRFIPKFSHIISPILELLKDNPKKFNWQKVHQDAVDKLIAIIEKGVSLYLPRFDRPFIIHTDASYVAVGATVSQYDDEGHLRLVAAVSRSFIKSERKLAPVQKEILGLLYTLTSLHYLLKGHNLIVYADAKSLTMLKTCATSSPYLSRLAMELSSYDFELYHLEGALNLEADSLSRLHKLQDKIMADDKLKNNAMTKDESLLFLEFLKIPNDYRFTVDEVRHMLTSEPLKSQLQAKIKARNPGSQKNPDHNTPSIIKSKKTHEPRYTKKHPLEKTSKQRFYSKNSINQTTKAANTVSHPINTSNCDIIHPPASFSDNDDISVHDTGSSCSEADYFTAQEDLSDYEHHLESLTHVNHLSLQLVTDEDPDYEELEHFLSEVTEAQNLKHSMLCFPVIRTDSQTEFNRHNNTIYASHFVLDTLQNEPPGVEITCHPSTSSLRSFSDDPYDLCLTSQGTNSCTSEYCAVHHITTHNELHINKYSSAHLQVDTNLPLDHILAVNNTIGIHNVTINETVADLKIKTEIVNTGILTEKSFVDAQKTDPQILEIREQYVPGQTDHISINNDIVYRKLNNTFVPILPECLEQFLFNCQHFHVLSGHRSADAMQKAISEQFYVSRLKQKLQAFTRNCYICSVAKNQKMQHTQQGRTVQALFPKHILSFDIFGAVETDEQGFRYVYSFIDNFSLFVINIRAKTRTTTEILAAFLQVFAIYSSIPEIVCSDNETALMTNEAKDFFNSFKIHHNHGASHAHWRLLSEGASIRKSKEFMRSILVSNPAANWYQALQLGTISLNNTKTCFGYTPLQLFYGNSKPQIDLFTTAKKYSNLDDYIKETTINFNKLIESINFNRHESVTKRTSTINENRKAKSFEVGDLIWLKSLNISPNRATKLQNHGPFQILQKINPTTYKLASLSKPNQCARISHSSHMEPFNNDINLTPIQFPSVT